MLYPVELRAQNGVYSTRITFGNHARKKLLKRRLYWWGFLFITKFVKLKWRTTAACAGVHAAYDLQQASIDLGDYT